MDLKELDPSNTKDIYTLYKDGVNVFASNSKSQISFFLSFLRIWFPGASYKVELTAASERASGKESPHYLYQGTKLYIAVSKRGYIYIRHRYPHCPTEEQLRQIKTWGFKWVPFIKAWFMNDDSKEMNDIMIADPTNLIDLFKK